MSLQSLDSTSIQQRLDGWLEVEFTFLQTAPLAARIASLSVTEQYQLLETIRRVAATQIQLAFELAHSALQQWQRLDMDLLESWARHTMERYDRAGLQAAMLLVRDLEHFQGYRLEQTVGSLLEGQQRVLLHFIHGLAGRELKIAQGEGIWSDSETLYLPRVLTILPNRAANETLYRAAAVYLWAQIRFGTFLPPLFAEPRVDEGLLALFDSMERLRLEGVIGRELPGLYRAMTGLRQQLGEDVLPSAWQPLAQQLQRPGTTVEQVLALSHQWLGGLQPLPTVCYQGVLQLERVRLVRQQRIERERACFRVELQQHLAHAPPQQPPPQRDPSTTEAPLCQEELLEGGTISVDQLNTNIPAALATLSQSITLDLGSIPPDYLTAAGAGDYELMRRCQQDEDPVSVWEGTYHEEGAFLYDEWNHERHYYHRGWCAVRECTVEPLADDFVAQTLQRYHSEMQHLYRTFEAMRDEDQLLKRQPVGDDIDIDALVDGQSDLLRGEELSDQLYTRMYRSQRNIAVLFMVDMSGSTRGWINDAEREALVLMSEALERLGDRYAIYGFSGTSRKRCEIYPIKGFSERYGAEVQGRISAIRPKDYTRMGAAVRHLTQKLLAVDANSRILITISDGKPDDYNDYHGAYGIEDTRRALTEARRSAIHPYCITIDTEARDYLPRLYGPAAFTVIADVKELPRRITEIYRRLTR